MSNGRRILKSWKEIASYLGVGIRTAQRWQHERGLPVKQPGTTRSAVLGLSDEIDRWLAGSSQALTKAQIEPPELADTVATDILWSRHSRPRQLEREIAVLLDIGRAMRCEEQKAILSKISSYALSLCKADSAGFSILETAADGKELFRWTGTRGRMAAFEGGTTPAGFSPCGFCLERNSPQLFRHPEQYYSYLRPISPISEVLLIPVHEENECIGTIWVICHQSRRKFDAEDARLMTDLGHMASAVFRAARKPAATDMERPKARLVRAGDR